MSNEILFISHRMPFPPDRGDKIRSHNVLKRLAAVAPVHVATFADDERDIAEEVELAAITRSYRLVRRVKPLILAGLQSLVRRQPVSLPAFASSEIGSYVAKVLRERPISTIYVFSSQMGQYIPDWFAGKVIVDFVDVDSAKFEAYAERGRGIVRWINRREASLLGREEARLARRADVSLLVSAEETALFRARLDPVDAAQCDIRTLRNGIDSQLFDASRVKPEAQMLKCPGPRLIFTGQMDYAPNIDAVQRTADRLLPRIRAQFPEATFHVVGRNPPDTLRRLDGHDGVHVWGEVPDVRTWLAASDLALVPLDIARGIQNKVLEAMAMSLPVVMSPQAATGIGGTSGINCLIGEDDDALVEQVLGLLIHSRQGWHMGNEARRFVIDHMSWQANLADLVDLIVQRPQAARNAA